VFFASNTGKVHVVQTRPSQLYKLALIFPIDTDNPVFRWVEFKYEDAGPESREEPVHQPHLGPADTCGEVYFNRVEISKRLLNSLPNKSMIWITPLWHMSETI
jgi:hypothetical protein